MGLRFMDQYSLLHFAVGVIAYFNGMSFVTWSVLHLIFELVENTETGMKIINNYFTFWPGGKSYADAAINSIGDQVFAMLGWLVAQQLDSLGKKHRWYVK